MSYNKLRNKGFTLVEVIVGTAVFLVVALASYQAYTGLFNLLSASQYKIIALNLINEQFEIARNMPYSQVGVVGGVPNGVIPYQQTLSRSGVSFIVTAAVRNIDLPYDGTISGTPTDLSPADNKFVAFTVSCSSCKGMSPITLSTNVAPKNLETASTNGALFIKVFDANGVPIKDASVHIENNSVTPSIVINDITDTNGMLQIVDVPPAVQKYEITVTKIGYTTDRTYTPGAVGNPSPTKPHATVVVQQVTQISFQIDKLSTLTIDSIRSNCTAVPGVHFSLVGSKLIGSNLPKYSLNLTTESSGELVLSSMEWDSYRLNSTDTTYDLIGLIPLNLIPLNPDSSQTVSMIVTEKNPRSLMVTVKDRATGLPLSGAAVHLSGTSMNSTSTTGQGFITQTNWAGGSGQSSYSDTTKYYSQDGNIEDSSPVGSVSLKNIFGSYPSTGVLESSTFDLGSASNFGSIIWSPVSQPPLSGTSSVSFQFATNATITPTTTWTYHGPDGTTGTKYLSSGVAISSENNGNRYARYKMFLQTNTSTTTPSVGDASFTYTSSCIPPGQVIFSGLGSGSYDLTVSKTGYSNYAVTVIMSSNWIEKEVVLSP